MKYFLIAGEASGDLHASNLMRALQEEDAQAEFCYYGGDKMQAVGGRLLCHYKSIAYMGFIPVLTHLNIILRAMKACKNAIVDENPDVVILVDYPGFNLSIAQFVKQHTRIPVYYYILPKVWAWKEKRVKKIKQFLDERFSILPFEVPFFEQKHGCPIHYIGNPSVDEIAAWKNEHTQPREAFLQEYGSPDKPIIAILPGSRIQEIKDNYRRMVLAALPYVEKGYQLLVAGAPDMEDAVYQHYLENVALEAEKEGAFRILHGCTFSILQQAEAAIVTSGTATLETALFHVPQVVCYYAPLGKLVRAIKPYFLKVKYISLVNLIVDRELVRELIGDEVNADSIRQELNQIVEGGSRRNTILQGYDEMCEKLGEPGAPTHAARMMINGMSRVKSQGSRE